MSGAGFGRETREALSELKAALRREREHLSVQLELGRMELKDEWDSLEQKWDSFESKAEGLGDDAKEVAERLGSELQDAYRSMRDRLSGKG